MKFPLQPPAAWRSLPGCRSTRHDLPIVLSIASHNNLAARASPVAGSKEWDFGATRRAFWAGRDPRHFRLPCNVKCFS